MSGERQPPENDAPLPPCPECQRDGFTAACPEAIAAGCPVLRASDIPPGRRTLAEIAADSERMADEAEARHRVIPPEVTR